MAEPTLRGIERELLALRAIVAEQGRQLAAQARDRRTPRAGRYLLPLLSAALLVALVPLVTLAAVPFSDLNEGSVHNASIDAIYQAGITRGCVPDVAYCPNDFVTRQEMATFLARTAGLGGNPPVARAAHAATADSAASAAAAGNANTVGGKAPHELLRVAQATALLDGSTLNLTENFQTLATVTIASPAAGFVFVTATATILAPPNPGIPNSKGSVRVRDLGPGGLTSPLADGGANRESVSLAFVFPVSAPGSRTFAVEANAVATSGIANTAVISALYVPFGASGGNTLALP